LIKIEPDKCIAIPADIRSNNLALDAVLQDINSDGDGIHPYQSEELLRQTVVNTEADLLQVGHHHLPSDMTACGVRMENPGGVSNPFPPDLRSSYALLKTYLNGYSIQFHRVDYDHEAVIQATRADGHPAWENIAAYMHGQNRPELLLEA
jgi:hypothetical protein